LIDNARKEAAERLLGDPALVIAEVAYLIRLLGAGRLSSCVQALDR
jgi:hypothetical protein